MSPILPPLAAVGVEYRLDRSVRWGDRMTTAHSTAARRVTYQLETLWDYDYVPTHDELAILYETAKKNQWNGSTAIDWSRPVGTEGPVLNVQMAFQGTEFYGKLTDEEKKEVEIRVSAWRLSQFLHGEQGALVVCGQLVNSIPELDAKLYASTQVVDEGRHVEVFERYVKKLHKIYPVDPLAQGRARRDPGHQSVGAEAARHADDRGGTGHRCLQRDAPADRRSHALPAPRLRAAGRGPPRELRLLRPSALDSRHGGGQARVPGGLHLQGVRPALRARRAHGLPLDPGRVERDGLGRREDLARDREDLADHQGLQQLPLPGQPDAAPRAPGPDLRADRPALPRDRPDELVEDQEGVAHRAQLFLHGGAVAPLAAAAVGRDGRGDVAALGRAAVEDHLDVLRVREGLAEIAIEVR